MRFLLCWFILIRAKSHSLYMVVYAILYKSCERRNFQYNSTQSRTNEHSLRNVQKHISQDTWERRNYSNNMFMMSIVSFKNFVIKKKKINRMLISNWFKESEQEREKERERDGGIPADLCWRMPTPQYELHAKHSMPPEDVICAAQISPFN